MNFTNKHIYASVASVGLGLFMRPLVLDNDDLQEDEKRFVSTYIRWSYMTVVLLSMIVGFAVGAGLSPGNMLLVWAMRSSILLWSLSIVLAIRYIAQDLPLPFFSGAETTTSVSTPDGTVGLVVQHGLYYLPLYNIYARYRQKDHIFLQESLFLCILIVYTYTIGVVIGYMMPAVVWMIIGILYIMRMMSSMLLDNKAWIAKKELLPGVATYTHPEQYLAYVRAGIIRTIDQGGRRDTRSYMERYHDAIAWYDRESKTIAPSTGAYLLGAVALVVFLTRFQMSASSMSILQYSMGIVVSFGIVGRYVIARYVASRPPLPGFDELAVRIQHISTSLRKKYASTKKQSSSSSEDS